MAHPFRCYMCGEETSLEGKRSWSTIAAGIVTFTWMFEFWLKYCPRCMAKLNGISSFLLIAIGVAVTGAVLYMATK